ncbi:MAG TPA: non-homologous end-joining DNA ligase [Streptosporangiaceae bacterium]|nr:non-homologous end-joining DNA ligase [Streptosporangiaceae bacterium]
MSPDRPKDSDARTGAAARKVSVEVEGRTLTLSNLDKVLYPAAGFTKARVIDYYLRIAPALLPHIAGRAVTIKRYPEGVDGEFFYQKNAPAHRPAWVPTARIASPGSTKSRETIEYLLGGDLPTLIWAANLAALELHTPMWRYPAFGEPDLVVFDLDPGEPATVVECCQVALLLRPLLTGLGLEPAAKTSGGKGMQLYAAVSAMTSQQTSDLAKQLAEELESAHPELVVSKMTKALRPGKVLIDWSQNNAAKTTVAPYSLRARSQPTVSTPVSWDEVGRCRRAADLVFTADDVAGRVEEFGDLFAVTLPA